MILSSDLVKKIAFLVMHTAAESKNEPSNSTIINSAIINSAIINSAITNIVRQSWACEADGAACQWNMERGICHASNMRWTLDRQLFPNPLDDSCGQLTMRLASAAVTVHPADGCTRYDTHCKLALRTIAANDCADRWHGAPVDAAVCSHPSSLSEYYKQKRSDKSCCLIRTNHAATCALVGISDRQFCPKWTPPKPKWTPPKANWAPPRAKLPMSNKWRPAPAMLASRLSRRMMGLASSGA